MFHPHNMNVTADPTAENEKELNSLLSAVREGDIGMVRSLLRCNADINIQDADGLNALNWAIKDDHIEIALELTTRGIDIDVKDSRGLNPLFLVVEKLYEMKARAIAEL